MVIADKMAGWELHTSGEAIAGRHVDLVVDWAKNALGECVNRYALLELRLESRSWHDGTERFRLAAPALHIG